MADLKISQLTAISVLTPATDVLPVVDVGGVTKKITTNQILASGGVASLASATITGAATVGTTLGVTGNLTVNGGTVNLANATAVNFGGLLTIYSDTAAGLFIRGRTVTGTTFQTQDGTNPLLNISNSGIFTFSDGAGGTRMTLNSTGLGIGVAPVTSHILSCAGPVAISGTNSGTRTSYIANASACAIYYTDGGGSGYFTDFGNLIIQPRTSADRSVVIATGSTTPVERAVVKSTGQVRFVPLAADPAGAESGDVYYNSSSNKLKCYNGTTWNDLF